MTGQVIFDTNILIDATKGFKEALDELAHWDNPTISCLTWVELYAGAGAADRPILDAFVKQFAFEVIPISASIMEIAGKLMSDRRIAGPKIALVDAIIAATAEVEGLVVISRNTRDFKTNVRVPYQLLTQCVVAVVNYDPPGDSPLPPQKWRTVDHHCNQVDNRARHPRSSRSCNKSCRVIILYCHSTLKC